ncbi:MAG: hypothetical protein ACXABY_33055 [Candidatus Thorarchaeota archaeon]
MEAGVCVEVGVGNNTDNTNPNTYMTSINTRDMMMSNTSMGRMCMKSMSISNMNMRGMVMKNKGMKNKDMKGLTMKSMRWIINMKGMGNINMRNMGSGLTMKNMAHMRRSISNHRIRIHTKENLRFGSVLRAPGARAKKASGSIWGMKLITLHQDIKDVH